MGSYQQIFVSGVLLVGAFLFGRYVTNQQAGTSGMAGNSVASSAETRRDAGSPSGQASQEAESMLQRSLRDRILGERTQRESSRDGEHEALPAEQTAANELTLPPQQEKIVAPDFSHLESGPLALPPPPDRSPFRLPTEIRGTNRSPAATAVKPPPGFAGAQAPAQPKPGVAVLELNRRPPQKMVQPPVQDVITRRGVLSVGQPAGKLVPVQTKSSKLTLSQREFVDYTTVFGDTLHSLSVKFFGSSDYYLDIYLANRNVLENPSEIPVNTTLKIPVVRPLPGQD